MKHLYYLLLFSSFLVNSFAFCKEIDIEKISQKPICSDSFYWNPMGSDELYRILNPLLKKHLKETNYDRLNLVSQYIDHYELLKKNNPSIDSLEVLESFIPDLSLGELNGSSCFSLNIDLKSRLPPHLFVYPIPATLFPASQQPYWPILSHVALIIPFYNQKNPEDIGFILLDPHLKIEKPLIITLNGPYMIQDLKDKGICAFSYEDGKLISKNLLEKNFYMTYYLTEITNFIEAGLKSTLAADRKITLYSRTEQGEVIASLILLLDTNTLRYHVQGAPVKEIPFLNFLSNHALLEDSLADELHIKKEKLYAVIEKILLHKNLLDDLYSKYTNFIKTSSRTGDFYIPT